MSKDADRVSASASVIYQIPPFRFKKGDQITHTRREFVMEDDNENNVTTIVEKHNHTSGEKIYGVIAQINGRAPNGQMMTKDIPIPIPGNSFEEAIQNVTEENVAKGLQFLQQKAVRQQIVNNTAAAINAGLGMKHNLLQLPQPPKKGG